MITFINESFVGDDLSKYQKWVDYDMKHYGKISEKTQGLVNKAGLEIVKDDHGDYEVIAKEESCGKKLKEEINPRDYTAINVSFDMAVPRNNIPRSAPGSSFVNAIYDAMDKLGYVMLTDDYGFSIEDADYYSEEDLEDLLSDEWI